MVKYLMFTRRPIDFEALYLLDGGQAEMQTEITLRQVAASAAHFIDLRAAAGCQSYPGPERASVGKRAGKFQQNPVTRRP